MNSFIETNLNELQWTVTPGLTAYLMTVSYFVHRTTMDTLMGSGGYKKLSLNYEGYITLLAERSYSPGELAGKQGVSKQACSKTLGELKKLGLITRSKNPDDSRSSVISLSATGIKLILDGNRATSGIQNKLAKEIGVESMEALVRVLETLCHKLEIELPTYQLLESATNVTSGGKTNHLNLLLPKLSNYCYQALIGSLSKKGFKGLKPNFSQVLGLIFREGGRIQYIASVVGVSKQAIASIAIELEQLGYITRDPDPNDKRQVILRLAPGGQELLRESEASVKSLEEVIASQLSPDDFTLLEQTMASLYHQTIGTWSSPAATPDKIQQLSQDLINELGVAGARTLAQHLMTITRGEP